MSGSTDREVASHLVGYLCGSAEEQEAHLRLLYVRARALVRVPYLRRPLDALVAALLEREAFSGRQARRIIGQALRVA